MACAWDFCPWVPGVDAKARCASNVFCPNQYNIKHSISVVNTGLKQSKRLHSGTGILQNLSEISWFAWGWFGLALYECLCFDGLVWLEKIMQYFPYTRSKISHSYEDLAQLFGQKIFISLLSANKISFDINNHVFSGIKTRVSTTIKRLTLWPCCRCCWDSRLWKPYSTLHILLLFFTLIYTWRLIWKQKNDSLSEFIVRYFILCCLQ